MKNMILFFSLLLLSGCASTEEQKNKWHQVEGTGGTYAMEVEGGKIYLYWDPPKPNTMVFVPER